MNIAINTIKQIVLNASAQVMKLYKKDYDSYIKEDKSIVTEADMISNDVLISELKAYGYPILSEESKDTLERCDSEFVWIIDPLDGTKDFTQKTDEFSIMVGLVRNGKPYLGVLSVPAERKVYFAVTGEGAYLEENGALAKRLQVSQISTPQDATMITSRNHLSEDVIQLAEDLQVKKWMKCGSNGVKIGRIAEGFADIFVNTTNRMGEWDACAPHIILTEAGGQMTDIQGNQILYNKQIPKLEFGIAASNNHFHSSILSHI